MNVEQYPDPDDPRFSTSSSMRGIQVLFLVALAAVAYYLYWSYQDGQRRAANAEKRTAQATTKAFAEPEIAVQNSLEKTLDHLEDFSYSENLMNVSVTWSMDSSLTASTAVFMAQVDTFETLKLIEESSLSYKTIVLIIRYPLVDQFGNSKLENVAKLRYQKTTVNKINWSGLDQTKIFDLAEEAIYHPAFQAELK